MNDNELFKSIGTGEGEGGASEIIDFTYRPKTEVREALIYLLITGVFSVGMVIASMTVPSYRGMVSLIAVMGIIASIYIYVRYIASEYAYAVISGGGVSRFVVTKRIGKRVDTLYMTELSSISEVAYIPGGGEPAARHGEVKHNFCPSMRPKQVYAARVMKRGGGALLVLELTDTVAARLLEYSRIARLTEDEE